MTASAFAPAKINLFLHVGPVDGDGYHPVCSWMSFADLGDRVCLEPGEGLAVEGPFAGALTAGADNLVSRAAAGLAGPVGKSVPGLRLHKALPVASGLGGGSSDAGATLRLLRAELRPDMPDPDLEAVAAALGADGAACLWGRPVIAEGRGERLSPAPLAPVLDAVLVNPGVACSTAAVYRAFDDEAVTGGADRPSLSAVFDNVQAVADALVGCRNDLERPAIAVAPVIGDVLALLRAQPQTLLARLSGSGATCFALCADGGAAERLAGEIAAAEPTWWVRACRLGGALPL